MHQDLPRSQFSINHVDTLSGWWLSHPSETYESIGMIIPNIWKNDPNVPNHQPAMFTVNPRDKKIDPPKCFLYFGSVSFSPQPLGPLVPAPAIEARMGQWRADQLQVLGSMQES